MRRFLWLTLVAVVGAMILTGCPVPLPPMYDSGSRQNVGERLPEFIVEGVTTRDDILLNLGEPDGRGVGDRWFAYGSKYSKGGVLFVAAAGGAVAAAGVDSVRYRRLVVRFDDQDVVTGAGFVERVCPRYALGGVGPPDESTPCIDVTIDDVEGVEVKSASGASAAGKRASSSPFATAVIRILPADIVEWQPEPSDVQLEVTDRRRKIVMERTSAGGPMSSVVLQPSETDLIKSIIAAKLKETIATQPKSTSAPPVICELTEFSITTPGTILYWDLTADIALTLRVGNQQRSLTAHTVTRTYWWPTESLITTVTTEALKVIATGSGPALSGLIAPAPAH